MLYAMLHTCNYANRCVEKNVANYCKVQAICSSITEAVELI